MVARNSNVFYHTITVKGRRSCFCIAPHCEKLASEALRHGSHSFYAATTEHLPLPRKAFTRRLYHR